MLMVPPSTGRGLRSGSLAKATGVSPDTIRHYERIGVLAKAARTESGYRVYPEGAVERVLVVQKALRIGFTLAELADVLKARDAGRVPCARVYEIANEKLKGNQRGHSDATADGKISENASVRLGGSNPPCRAWTRIPPASFD